MIRARKSKVPEEMQSPSCKADGSGGGAMGEPPFPLVPTVRPQESEKSRVYLPKEADYFGQI